MKIKTWIKFRTEYIPPRCRKPRYREGSDYVLIPIQETAFEKLQLAFEVETYNGVKKLYLYKNQLWRKAVVRDVCAGGEKEYGYQTALEALKFWNLHGSSYFSDGSRESVIQAATADLKKYIVIGKDLYVRENEPKYEVCTFGMGNNHGGTALLVTYQSSQYLSKDYTFNALEADEAIACHEATARARGDTADIGRAKASITVHMPEAVRYKSHRKTARKEGS